MTTARDLAEASRAAVGAKDRERWLSLFAPDGIVEDPVGPSAFDPTGNGHCGKAAIAAFWDMAIAPNRSVEFEIHKSYLCGTEVANVVTLHITIADGTLLKVDCVIVYRATADGKLASLRAFWEMR